MRITYMLTTADMGAGTERTIFTQANWMSRHAEVEILSIYRTAPSPHFVPAGGVRLRYLGDRPDVITPSHIVPGAWDNQFDASLDDKIERAFSELTSDVVVTTTPALAYLVARYAPAGTRIVHQEHRYSSARGAALEPLALAAPRLSAVAVLTRRNHDFLRTLSAFDDTEIHVIPNPIEVGSFPVSPASEPVIVSAGRFVKAKGFDELVRAFALVADELPDWKLRIFGKGPARSQILTAIRRHGLEARVELPGDAPDMPAQLAKASIFALSSRSEALPMVLLEAQAVGLPVVSYDTQTGPREIVAATSGGVIVPVGSVHGLAAGLRRLALDANLRQRLGADARSGAWQFDIDTVMKLWVTLFNDPERRPNTSDADPEPADDRVFADISASPSAVATAFATGLRSTEVAFARAAPPASGAWKFITAREDAAQVLSTLIDAADPAMLVSARWRGHQLRDSWRASDPTPLLAADADEYQLADQAGTSVGTVQLWTVDEHGLRHRPSRSEGPSWVDEDAWRQWMAHSGTTPSGRPYWNERTFPIDVVYTWVDGSDPAWIRRKEQFGGNVTHANDAVRDARFRDRGELLFSIRSVRKYMPWVRRIFIVTDRQAPPGVVREFPEVTIVDHAEIFPDPAVLPVFNSHAIEASLHRIDGLSEHYIYFNDDVVVARPLSSEHFFHNNGIAKFFPGGAEINYGGHTELPHLQAGANNRRLMLKEYGFELTRNLLHTPHPQRKSVVEELEAKHPHVFEATRRTRFRSPTDYSIASSLAPFYGYMTGRFVPATIGYRYIPLHSDALSARLQGVLKDPRVDVVALGEPSEDQRHHRNEKSILREFLLTLVFRGSVPVYAEDNENRETVEVAAASTSAILQPGSTPEGSPEPVPET